MIATLLFYCGTVWEGEPEDTVRRDDEGGEKRKDEHNHTNFLRTSVIYQVSLL